MRWIVAAAISLGCITDGRTLAATQGTAIRAVVVQGTQAIHTSGSQLYSPAPVVVQGTQAIHTSGAQPFSPAPVVVQGTQAIHTSGTTQ